MFNGDLEGDFVGDSKGFFRGDFKQDMEGDLLSSSGQVSSKELDSEVGLLVDIVFNSDFYLGN